MSRHFGVVSRVVPVTNDLVRTMIVSDEGTLDFQHYFVQRRCEPEVKSLAYAGAADARVLPEIRQLLEQDSLQAIVLCPSNPWLSLAPMLEIPSFREVLRESTVPVIAVSPLIGGQAVKGPTAKIMRDLRLEVSSAAIASYYEGVIDGFVLDNSDAYLASQIPVATHVTSTLMKTTADKQRLAREVMEGALPLDPADREGQVAYLTSLRHIGEKRAEKLCDEYGEEVLQEIAANPERVFGSLRGVSADQAAAATQSWYAGSRMFSATDFSHRLERFSSSRMTCASTTPVRSAPVLA